MRTSGASTGTALLLPWGLSQTWADRLQEPLQKKKKKSLKIAPPFQVKVTVDSVVDEFLLL